MRRSLLVAMVVTACAHAPPPLVTEPSAAEEAHAEDMAIAFLERVSQKDPSGAEYWVSEDMRHVEPPQKLADWWTGLTDTHGALVRVYRTRVEPVPEGLAAIEVLQFERGYQAVTVTISKDGDIVSVSDDATAIVAERFVDRLAHRDFRDATVSFDRTMRATDPPDKVADFWRQQVNQRGAFRSIEKVNVKPTGETSAALVKIRFAHEPETMKVVVNDRAQITGYFVE